MLSQVTLIISLQILYKRLIKSTSGKQKKEGVPKSTLSYQSSGGTDFFIISFTPYADISRLIR